MSWVRMNIQNGQVTGELEMDQLGSGETKSVIDGFFGAFGLKEYKLEAARKAERPEIIAPIGSIGSPPPLAPEETPVPPKPEVSAAELPAKVMASTIISKQAVQKIVKDAAKEAAKRIDKPSLLNSERSLSTPLGEKLAEAYQKIDSESLNVISNSTEANEKVEDYMVTGIKYKDGVAHYKCRYWCKNPECRCKGNHYILPDEKKVDCYYCGSAHEVREAVHGQPLQRDNWGNFFIADHLA